MNKKIVTVLLVLVASVLIMSAGSFANAKPEDQMEGVAELTDATFESFIKSNKYVIVEFYAPVSLIYMADYNNHCINFVFNN